MNKLFSIRSNTNTLSIGRDSNTWNEYVVHSNGIFQTNVMDPSGPTSLPAGAYVAFTGQKGEVFFLPKSIESDQLLNLPDMTTNIVLNDLNHFWKAESKVKYHDLGMVYKRGILMFGAPGCGKSATVIKLADNIIQDNGIVLFNPSPSVVNEAIKQIRSIEGTDRKVLVILEEVETMCDNGDFLSLLDGELQVDNVAYVATTNYIDQIPKRIKNRPSRFARVIEVGKPSYSDRLAYISFKLKGLTTEEHNKKMAEATNNMVLDQVKDVIISTYIFNTTLEDAIAKISDMEDEYTEELEEKEDENDIDQATEDFLYNKGVLV